MPAWESGQKITVNGLIYGLLHDLQLGISNSQGLESEYQKALAALRETN